MSKWMIALLVTASLTSPALAQGQGNDHIAIYGGVFDVLDDENSVQAGLEYRFVDVAYGIRPTVGINVDEESAVYGYAGLNLDIPIVSSVYLTPNFMVGAYSQGSGKDLGGALEFRSGLELSYAFPNDSRLGIAFNHISNASIYNSNPGAEALLVVYQHPLNWQY